MYSDITIWANNIEQRSNAALAALRHAEHFNGTITAVYAKLDKVELQRWQTNATADLIKKMLADIDQQEIDCRSAFERLSKNVECKTVWRTVPESGDPIQQMLCTDLIVVDQPIPDDKSNAIEKSILNRIILETKRPVLMVPDGWKQSQLPSKITLGWNSSAESMRAVSAALPLMHLCERVGILCIMDDRMSQIEQAGIYRIKDYLTRKKIHNELIIEASEKHSKIPAMFLELAAESGASLIVVGGYGHSRIREIILGGMTDYLIRNAAIPVLFSH